MGKLKRFLPAAGLIALCALIFSLRLHTYDEPLERDLTTYAVIAHETMGKPKSYSARPPETLVAFARITAHYFTNAAWLEEDQLLRDGRAATRGLCKTLGIRMDGRWLHADDKQHLGVPASGAFRSVHKLRQ